ncbi:carcinoembryonic antigen-related cell adhesion molecule 1 isoform X2 [Oncorhynchus kisutch]|uniref:carcinoembryonic antigen-related cell adhesion molecule 1 isoform X2 n=1 Tax=Oncorhynchus kisutch TaxID=8019 RepID=UPI0012DCC52A|nr:carcinoembryonic antigen-related cell adhesion molecule 1 isoform X2 [Oncorhynchus kisutch]
MPKLTLIRLCFWLCLARTVVSRDDLYLKVGGELVLKPDKSTVPDSISSILWKHGKNKVAEWDKDFGGLDIYASFKERTTLDQTTGELRISGLKKTDSGVYSVEFNSKLLDQTYTLSVFKAVPKPTITSSCNPDKTSCTLTCEGDTTDAEPVTYSWKVGASAWEVLDKQINVNKSDTGKSTNSYKYICKMKNPVSEEVSDPIGQRFGPKAVPKPTITYTCNSNKTTCILTCESDTTDAEPVTYSWKVGEGAWEVIEKWLIVSKSDTGKSTNSYKYICKLKNSAGEGEVSDPVGSVFYPEPSEVGGGWIVGVVVIVVIVALVAIVITVWLVWKKKKEYPQDTWIDFLRKYFGGIYGRMCGDAGNNQNTVALDTVYSVVGEKSSRDYSMNQNNNNQPTNTAKGSDRVQPEQGISLTGKDNADKSGKGQGNGAKGVM